MLGVSDLGLRNLIADGLSATDVVMHAASAGCDVDILTGGLSLDPGSPLPEARPA
ncbi:hypothetical protein Rrhod_3120 [Rhodococcus rhodnii LMG 5362]|uniref:Uncharacterized protein n=1 Tax=Rhodococcus rhodnii LMG 5362 TaxID=1273125 RepID=R7WJQ7_9NOCA|nr:hypothetical protein Rrhod_3120 [Rhodococcus rhodnii LMG 5362]